jgi:hypothetical protein
MRIATLSAWLLLSPVLAHAQAAGPQPGAICDPKKTDCGCERNWGCWELLYSTKQSLLGVKASAMHLWGGDHARDDAALLTTYFTEHYGTRKKVSGHFLAFGAIGGGTAGTEGSVGGALDFGYRGPIADTKGIFVRAGPSAFVLGNHDLHLSLIEPLESRVGYQYLDGDRLFEWGMTFGHLLIGRFKGPDSSRELEGGEQLRSYFIVRSTAVRLEASIANVRAASNARTSSIWLSRAAGCGYPRPLAICLEALYVTRVGDGATNRSGAASYTTLHAIYAGLTVGLTP